MQETLDQPPRRYNSPVLTLCRDAVVDAFEVYIKNGSSWLGASLLFNLVASVVVLACGAVLLQFYKEFFSNGSMANLFDYFMVDTHGSYLGTMFLGNASTFATGIFGLFLINHIGKAELPSSNLSVHFKAIKSADWQRVIWYLAILMLVNLLLAKPLFQTEEIDPYRIPDFESEMLDVPLYESGITFFSAAWNDWFNNIVFWLHSYLGYFFALLLIVGHLEGKAGWLAIKKYKTGIAAGMLMALLSSAIVDEALSIYNGLIQIPVTNLFGLEMLAIVMLFIILVVLFSFLMAGICTLILSPVYQVSLKSGAEID